MIEAAIFDVGGVLIANDPAAVRLDILATLEIEEAVLAPAWAELLPLLGNGQITEEDFWRRLVARTGAPGALPAESLFVREYARGYAEHPEVMALVARLRSLGLRTAALSNTIAPHVAYMLGRRLFDGFDVRVFSNEFGASKPDPSIYLETLRLLGLAGRPGGALFVDDRAENVVAAQQLGIHGLVFTDAARLAADLRGLGLAV